MALLHHAPVIEQRGFGSPPWKDCTARSDAMPKVPLPHKMHILEARFRDWSVRLIREAMDVCEAPITWLKLAQLPSDKGRRGAWRLARGVLCHS